MHYNLIALLVFVISGCSENASVTEVQKNQTVTIPPVKTIQVETTPVVKTKIVSKNWIEYKDWVEVEEAMAIEEPGCYRLQFSFWLPKDKEEAKIYFTKGRTANLNTKNADCRDEKKLIKSSDKGMVFLETWKWFPEKGCYNVYSDISTTLPVRSDTLNVGHEKINDDVVNCYGRDRKSTRLNSSH